MSRALNNHPDVSPKAKEKIQEVVAKYDFVPNSNARQLKVQQRKSIIIIVKGAFNIFFSNILERMQTRISSFGYAAEVHYIDEYANEVATAVQLQRELKPLGIIFLGGNTEIFKRHFYEMKLPCVLATTVSEELKFENLSMVGVDDKLAGKQGGEYLLEKGHTKIGVIGGKEELSYISKQRYEGFCDAYAQYGMQHDKSYYQTAIYNLEAGYHAMKQMLETHQDITAVFCMSDLMAMGAKRAVYDAGLCVPQDISIIGFDGTELGTYSVPRLASLEQPQKEIADQSVDLLVSQIEKETSACTTILQTTLLSGESVATIQR